MQSNLIPPDPREVDWKAAPPLCKLYRNCEQIPCAGTELAPVRSDKDTRSSGGSIPGLGLGQIGQMLADIYGFTRQCYQPSILAFLNMHEEYIYSLYPSLLLRSVPSGGALFPCEVYLLVGSESEDIPAGIYHYDAAHQALDILRRGDYSTLLQSALAHPQEPPPVITLLLSCVFWKDGFKYGAFSYRLQGLDIGTVISQTEIVARHAGFSATLHYQFLDHILNNLLGLDPLQESVYAVLTWGQALHLASQEARDKAKPLLITPDLAKPVPEAMPLASIAHWPLVEAVHRASLLDTREAFRALHRLAPIQPPAEEEYETTALWTPDPPLDLWQARHSRHSANGFFLPQPLVAKQLGALLHLCMRGTTNDLDDYCEVLQHTLLYCVVCRVQDIPSGIYRYEPQRHALSLVRAGEMTSQLQGLLRQADHMHFYTSISFFPIGNY